MFYYPRSQGFSLPVIRERLNVLCIFGYVELCSLVSIKKLCLHLILPHFDPTSQLLYELQFFSGRK